MTAIASYLIERFERMGVAHVFGVAGDYNLTFLRRLEESAIRVIGCTQEDCAGFAADGYARVRGAGAAYVTFGVGGLGIINAVAGCYAEKVPVVVVSGAPGVAERRRHAMLHHKPSATFEGVREMFERVTVAAVSLEDAARAPAQIDDALAACRRLRQPVYIELPRDLVEAEAPRPAATRDARPDTDGEVLAEALDEAVARIRAARRPVLLCGVEVLRHGLSEAVEQIAERGGIPIAETVLGKSAVRETHAYYAGVYGAAGGEPAVTRLVEGSDCLVMLGTFMTDMDTAGFSERLDPAREIDVQAEAVRVSHHLYPGVGIEDFVRALADREMRSRPRRPGRQGERVRRAHRAGARPVSTRWLSQRLQDYVTDETVLVCDVGVGAHTAVDLSLRRRGGFIANRYYVSMGFAVPAALGAQLADRSLRPLVLVGDGSFQMTGTELATAVRQGLDPMVLVLNNRGYTAERAILDGPFNDLAEWRYERIPELLGGGRGHLVRSERDFEAAMADALAHRGEFSILNVELDRHDIPPALERLGRALAARPPEDPAP